MKLKTNEAYLKYDTTLYYCNYMLIIIIIIIIVMIVELPAGCCWFVSILCSQLTISVISCIIMLYTYTAWHCQLIQFEDIWKVRKQFVHDVVWAKPSKLFLIYTYKYSNKNDDEWWMAKYKIITINSYIVSTVKFDLIFIIIILLLVPLSCNLIVYGNIERIRE